MPSTFRKFLKGIRLKANDHDLTLNGQIKVDSADDRLKAMLRNGGEAVFLENNPYSIGSIVSYQEQVYRCVANTTNELPLDTDYWEVYHGEVREILTSNQNQVVENKQIDGTSSTGTNIIKMTSTNVSYDDSLNVLVSLGSNLQDALTSANTAIDDIDNGILADGVIDDLSDVDTTTNIPSNGQVLKWDQSSVNWTPQGDPIENPQNTLVDTIVINGSTSQNIGGFIFDKTMYISGIYNYTSYRVTDNTELIEVGTLYIHHNTFSDTINITKESEIDNTGLTFSVNSSTGQVSYDSTNIAGANYNSKLVIEIKQLFEII